MKSINKNLIAAALMFMSVQSYATVNVESVIDVSRVSVSYEQLFTY